MISSMAIPSVDWAGDNAAQAAGATRRANSRPSRVDIRITYVHSIDPSLARIQGQTGFARASDNYRTRIDDVRRSGCCVTAQMLRRILRLGAPSALRRDVHRRDIS